jgi:hypothetical protein
MGARQRKRPVSAAVSSGPLTLNRGLPRDRSAGPSARDPPSRELPDLSTGRERAMAKPAKGRPPRTHGQKRRGDARTSPLPNAGLAKLVPVSASYVTCRSTRCLPLVPAIWKIRTIGTGRQPGIPRVSRDPVCIIHGEPVRSDACLSRLTTRKTPKPPSQFSSPSSPASASLTGARRYG